jgi:hypothetical protein
LSLHKILKFRIEALNFLLFRAKYQQLIGGGKSLMDYKDDIFATVHAFLMALDYKPPDLSRSDVNLLAR